MRFRQTGPSLVIDTPAKLNLHLEVLGQRADGFHELETVMVSVNLFDTLALTLAPESIRLTCETDPGFGQGTPPPVDDRNLVIRAARMLREMTGVRHGVDLHLTKRIPSEAGLGGGSSDAAAALVGLNRLWNLGLTSEALHTAAARLGSDVNFFLDSTPLAMCRGRGEQIAAAPLKGPMWFVIVKPPAGLSTAAVFRTYRQESATAPRSATPLLTAVQRGDVGECGKRLWNALQPPSRHLSVQLAMTLDRLLEQKLPGVVMTGSGSACVGLCWNRSHALQTAARLQRMLEAAVFVVQTAV